MKKRLVVGNWKMNLVRGEARALAAAVVRGLGEYSGVGVVVAPPFTSLGTVYDVIRHSGVELGAQNVCWRERGEYTGEVSPPMLVDCGCRWVIVGHSERRIIFGETDSMIAEKVRACMAAGLTPILCIGETIEERVGGRTQEVLRRQMLSALADVELERSDDVVIAYEPVWAIGSGRVPSSADIDSVGEEVRSVLGALFGHVGEEVRLLYGGSVRPDNIEELMKARIDGTLVGGASLSADSFIGIIRAVGDS